MTATTIDTVEYERQGFAIVRNIFQGAVLEKLQIAADRFVGHARAADGSAESNRLDLLHSSFESHYEYELINCLDSPLVLGLSELIAGGPLKANSYYINVDTPSMAWHQDFAFLPPDVPADFDLQAFRNQTPFSQVQWNLALVDDAVLMVVPGTHRGELTAETLQMINDSRARNEFVDDIPGAVRVELRSGDGVVYNNNLAHGVDNPSCTRRRTLHWFWVCRNRPDPYNYYRYVLNETQRRTISPRLLEMSQVPY